MARKQKARYPWGDDARKGPMIGRPTPEPPPPEPTREEREYTRWLAGELAARIMAEADPEGDALEKVTAALRGLSAVAARRVLDRAINQLKG